MKRVLFLCTGNSCRSQMGEVVMNSFGKGRYQAFSAGAAPAGFVHPMAIKVMQDAKFPTAGLRSKSWEEFKGQEFDLIITVCDLARQNCPIWPGTPQQIHWSVEDPAKAEGTEPRKLDAFKKVLGEMQQRVRMILSFPEDRLGEFKATCGQALKAARPVAPEPGRPPSDEHEGKGCEKEPANGRTAS